MEEDGFVETNGKRDVKALFFAFRVEEGADNCVFKNPSWKRLVEH
jgi:hypothetical protein